MRRGSLAERRIRQIAVEISVISDVFIKRRFLLLSETTSSGP